MIEDYVKAKINQPSLTDAYFCTENGYSLDALREEKTKNKEWAKTILSKRREGYADQMRTIDEALIQAASRGDVKAAELLYRRFDGWCPTDKTTGSVVTDFAALLKLSMEGDDNG